MPRENMTLEQVQEREEKLLAQKKERASNNVAKIEARLLATTDKDEKARLSELLERHKAHQKEVENINPKERADLRFDKFKGRFSEREEILKKKVEVNPVKQKK